MSTRRTAATAVRVLRQLRRDPRTIGLLLSLTLAGDMLISLWMTTHADRIGRRKMLIAGAALMLLAGLVFVSTRFFPVLMLAAIIGSFLVQPRGDDLGAALRRGTNFALFAAGAGVLGLAYWVFGDVAENPLGIWIAVMAGLIVGWLVGKISEWFTSDDYKKVKEIARQSQTGPATVIISGIAEGMKSAAYSVLVVAGLVVVTRVGVVVRAIVWAHSLVF